MVDPFGKSCGVDTLPSKSLFEGREWRSGVDKETVKAFGKGDRREQKGIGGVYPSRWSVGGIVFAFDIDCVYPSTVGSVCKKEVDPFEYFVDGPVPAPAIPPSFNDSIVIPVGQVVLSTIINAAEQADETLESNSFSPADIARSI
jgi:hypothetical protein